MHNLLSQKCVPCEGGTKPLTPSEYAVYLSEIADWEVIEEKKLKKTFKCKDFAAAMVFVNKVADLSEQEGHHPNINLFSWNRVTLTLTTHAIGGLSVNDFILAAKIDRIMH